MILLIGFIVCLICCSVCLIWVLLDNVSDSICICIFCVFSFCIVWIFFVVDVFDVLKWVYFFCGGSCFCFVSISFFIL